MDNRSKTQRMIVRMLYDGYREPIRTLMFLENFSLSPRRVEHHFKKI